MANPDEISDKANAAFLKRGLLRSASLSFAFITLIWMSILAAHTYLRFPWGGKGITSSKWCCAYLIGPALLAVILGVLRVLIDPVSNDCRIFAAEAVEVCKTGGWQKIKDAGKTLKDSTQTQNKGLFIVLFALSIACIVVAGYLDRATDKSKIKGLAIAECVLLAGIITSLVALAFTYYICENGARLSNIENIHELPYYTDWKGAKTTLKSDTDLRKKIAEKETEREDYYKLDATQVNSNSAQNIR